MPNPEGCSVLKQLKAVGKQAEMMFVFHAFAILELQPTEAHFVLGFGQAFVSTAATPTRWVHQKLSGCLLLKIEPSSYFWVSM